MARIRSIKPEAFTSESLARLDYFTRWTFAGLWTYLDDYGYGRADVRLIRAALFPLDDDATVGKVGKALDALDAEGCVCRFTVDGRDYMHAPKWADHQKVSHASGSRIPPCPEHDNSTEGTVSEPSGEIPEGSEEIPEERWQERAPERETAALSSGLEDSGGLRRDSGGLRKTSERKGTGNREQGTGNREGKPPRGGGEFPEFWDLYPRKQSKADAQRAWAKAVKRAEALDIIAGLTRHLPILKRTEAKFIPHPATWLNGDRWADEVDTGPAHQSPEDKLWTRADRGAS